MLQWDHLKSAPCVSNVFLATVRVLMSVGLLGQTIATMSVTANNYNFEYISQWNQLFTTILMTTMAVGQIQNEK